MYKKCIQRPDFTKFSSVNSPQPWTPRFAKGYSRSLRISTPHNSAQSKEGPFRLFAGWGANRREAAVLAVTNKAPLHQFVPKLKLFFI